MPRDAVVFPSVLLDNAGEGVFADGALAEAGAVLGDLSCATGSTDAMFGELVLLVLGWAAGNDGTPAAGVADGGGGRGAIPTLFLSLAAAAAAALAYLSPSPAGLVGTDAGFIPILLVAPLLIVASGVVCTGASVGRGDLSCVDGRRPADPDAVSVVARCFPDGALAGFGSGSAGSSCIDWLSCDEPLSPSMFMP